MSEQSEAQPMGVLLFAFSNQKVDYVQIAELCARRVRATWDLPVCIVSDVDSDKIDYTLFDSYVQISKKEMDTNSKIYIDYGEDLHFWNSSRVRAYELTPYRRTILLDVDFLVQTRTIPDLWDGQDFALTRQAYSVFEHQRLSSDMKVLSEKTQIPMAWATVVCFDRESELTRMFFDEWKKALKSYSVYANIMGFSQKPIRNDFAASLALYKMLDGVYTSQRFQLPYSIPSLMPESSLIGMLPDCLLVSTKGRATTAVYSDLHVMNKKSILECLNSKIKTYIDDTPSPAPVFSLSH
jgi:hypothetical protein